MNHRPEPEPTVATPWANSCKVIMTSNADATAPAELPGAAGSPGQGSVNSGVVATGGISGANSRAHS